VWLLVSKTNCGEFDPHYSCQSWVDKWSKSLGS
jgi:hypothetical protein